MSYKGSGQFYRTMSRVALRGAIGSCQGFRRVLIYGVLLCVPCLLHSSVADEVHLDIPAVRRLADTLVGNSHQYYRDAVMVDGVDVLWVTSRSENARTVFSLRRIADNGSFAEEIATWEHPYKAVLHSQLLRHEEEYLVCATGLSVDFLFYDISCWMLRSDGTGTIGHVQVTPHADAMASLRAEAGPDGRIIIAYHRVVGHPYVNSTEPVVMVLDRTLASLAEVSLPFGGETSHIWHGDLDIGISGNWISFATVESGRADGPPEFPIVCLALIDSKSPAPPAARVCKRIGQKDSGSSGDLWLVRDGRRLVVIRNLRFSETVTETAAFTEDDFGSLFESVISCFPTTRLTPFFEVIQGKGVSP